jgi:hypothetical protein
MQNTLRQELWMSENVFIEQSNKSVLSPEYALVYNLFYKYKPRLIQMFEMKDLPFNGESAFQHKGV